MNEIKELRRQVTNEMKYHGSIDIPITLGMLDVILHAVEIRIRRAEAQGVRSEFNIMDDIDPLGQDSYMHHG